ncbi:hypothetical protein [Pseudoalteromonas tunicata]|uniref:hypothetical protein n=1 Tax=Pseudoalteromonas tunicata TaxID=314281 RepID=UPI00273FDB79|nr:hypothetical protein [Pseudoalteromonas tunicata]MDP4985608.1 hypothetical protein [Pseudoalteromonas tunicata]
MKISLVAISLIAISNSVYAADPAPTLSVDQEAIVLNETDFRPITTTWANREVITGYEALINLSGAKDTLIFSTNGEVSAKWFAANFSMVTKLTCNGIPIGMSKVYGQRVNGQSTPAKPMITELRHNVEQCDQLKIELSKEGSLSRQFYTSIQNISFTVSVHGLNNTQGGI